MYWPKMRIVKTRNMQVRSKIFLYSKTVQDYADFCLIKQAVGQTGHSLS